MRHVLMKCHHGNYLCTSVETQSIMCIVVDLWRVASCVIIIKIIIIITTMSLWMTSDGAKHLCSSGGGGLGVRNIVLLAPSAYLASAASTTDFTSILLPARLRDVKDSGVDAALVAWTSQAANPLEVSTPTPSASAVQRVLG